MLTDVGTERAVLAGLFNYGPEAHVEISDIISHQSFSEFNNQVLYKCIERIIANNGEVDVPSILSAAQHLGFTESVNTKQELEYIDSLMRFPVKKDNIPLFAAQLKKLEFARNIKKISKSISDEIDGINGDESIDEIISIVEKPLTDFLRNDKISEKPTLIGDNVLDYIQFLKENKCDQIGIPTGFPRFDAAIGGGLRRKCVDLVSARPKVGKSVFADNVAINVASKGVPVLMLDTEMSREDHIHRILANTTGLDINYIATGKFGDNPEHEIIIRNAAKLLETIPYRYINISGQPFEHVLNIIKRWIIHEVGQNENGTTNDCLVVYDYLKLMSASSISNSIQEYQALGFQITALHNLTVKYDFPCLSFVQLNRDGITKESTDAISGSDRLIWLCTSFTIFKEKSPEEIAEDGPKSGNRKLVPIVCRHGPGMSDGNYINMQLVKECSALKEINTRDEKLTGGFIEGADVPFDISGE